MSKLTNHPAFSLLSRAHSPTLTSTILSDELLHKPLKLLPTTAANRPSDVRQARQRAREARKVAQARKNRKPKPLTAKEKRELGLHIIPEEQKKWEVFEPLHRMWLGYMREVLGIKGKERVYVDAKTAGPLISTADMHGSMMKVVKSRCVSRVGTEGIVAKETKETFEIITRKNELKVIPKEYTLFELRISVHEVDHEEHSDNSTKPMELVFEIHGSSFAHRPADRISKKMKLHIPKDV